MKTTCLLIICAALLSACSNPVVDLKSPCVGAQGSPCEHRAPAQQNS